MVSGGSMEVSIVLGGTGGGACGMARGLWAREIGG